MPVRRSEPHRLEAAHGDSRGLWQKHQRLGVGARPCPSTSAGEEAARLRSSSSGRLLFGAICRSTGFPAG